MPDARRRRLRDGGAMARLSLLGALAAALWSTATVAAAQQPATEPWPDENPWPGAHPQQLQPAQPPPPQAQPAEPPPPSLLETSTHLMDLMAVFGFTTEESFDDALRAHGYTPSTGVFGADVTSLWRVLPVLWLGGRLGYRARAWDQPGMDSVDAFAGAAWLVAELRLPLGRAWDLGAGGAVGGALVGLYVGDTSDLHPAPSAWGGVSMGVRIVDPVRIYTRFGYEYLEAVDVNGWGHDVNLSGGSWAIGVEIRR